MRTERTSHRSAFTLVEMLVVIGIIALLSGMLVAAMKSDPQRAALNLAAVELRNTIRQARSMAMTEGQAYAITFNMTIPGNGRVLRNFAPGDSKDFVGRHWYALIAPAQISALHNNGQTGYPPLIRNVKDDSQSGYIQTVREHQVGPRHYLPRGVRFLALSDIDGGATMDTTDRWDPAIGAWGRNAPNMLYPIPWFGSVVDRGGKYELFPWGFLAESGKNYAAFGATLASSKDGGVRSAFGAGFNYPGFHGPDGKHLIDGDLLDAFLLFMPDGRIAWEHAYNNKSGYGDWRRKICRDWTSQHLTEQTGGFHITLARDIDDNDEIYKLGELHLFETERDALQSILPLVRVYAHAYSGSTDIRQGPAKAPAEINWVEADGTVHSHAEMGSGWWGVHPTCWIQQHQALYNGSAGDTQDQRAYHHPDNPFLQFKPARTW